MTRIAIKHGGTVDKYIGDAIMVLFGDPHTLGRAKEDALACVRMALEMKKELIHFRKNGALWVLLNHWIFVSVSIVILVQLGILALWIDLITPLSEMVSTWHPDLNPMQMSIKSSISEDTYLLIREEIACDKLDKIIVKNIKHPIQTYEVRGKKAICHLQMKER